MKQIKIKERKRPCNFQIFGQSGKGKRTVFFRPKGIGQLHPALKDYKEAFICAQFVACLLLRIVIADYPIFHYL